MPNGFFFVVMITEGNGFMLVIPVLCNTLLCQKFKFFAGKKMSVVLRRCAMRESFWVIWVERNGGFLRIFLVSGSFLGFFSFGV